VLEVGLAAVVLPSRRALLEAVVDVFARQHDAPADCVLAAVVELDRLELLVRLASAPPLRALVHHARLHRLHEGAVPPASRVQNACAGRTVGVQHVLGEVHHLRVPIILPLAQRRLPTGKVPEFGYLLLEGWGEIALLLVEQVCPVQLSEEVVVDA
jgi:hypothetical protein